MSESNSGVIAERVVDRLIRRLRVSDAPEKFQKRAASAMRDALGAKGVAWIPTSSREPIVVAGGISPDVFRSVVAEPGDGPIRVFSREEGRGVSTEIEGDGGRLMALAIAEDRPNEFDVEALLTVSSLIGTQRANARSYIDLKELLFGVIRALTSAIDAKDPYTSGHSERVARIAVRIGQELGISAHDQGDLYLMGLLHDVGKIGVDDGVLKKPGKLTEEEYEQIQAHVRIGVHILQDLKKLHHLLPGVAYHHERLDGSGYPAGLRGDKIPLPARILAAADSFDAMSSSRPYRRGMLASEIDAEFRKGAGRQWDSRVVEALFACRRDLELIREKGLGNSLQRVIDTTLGRNRSAMGSVSAAILSRPSPSA